MSNSRRPHSTATKLARHAARLDLPGPGEPEQVLVSACLIVKDEHKALPECFESLHRVVDEVVVYDTGSTDGTIELCRRAGAEVIEGFWDEDFSRARNAALEACRGKWILWVDADERFRCPNVGQLRAALRDDTITGDAMSLDIYNVVDENETDHGNIHRALRIFRRDRCQWYGVIHEQVDLLPGLTRNLEVTPLLGAFIEHIGYRPDVVEERNKLERNLRLAQAALDKDSPARGQEGVAEMNVARALAAMNRFEEAQPYFEAALDKVVSPVARRATLLFCVQNLLALGRNEDARAQAATLCELSSIKDVACYFEGVAWRRLGDKERAVELLERARELKTEDGFAFPDTMRHAELAGAYIELGRTGEAADLLVRIVESCPEVLNIRTALNVFAAAGRPVEELVQVMPEDRLDKVAAALLLVPPVVADPIAEALWARFGGKPQLLAAAIRFAPLLATARALDWSARLRAIGMLGSCPLVAQARLEMLEVQDRVRAAVTAHAAFADPLGAALAVSLAPGVHHDKLFATLSEVRALDRPVLAEFAGAAAAAGADHAGPVGSADQRREAVSSSLLLLGEPELAEKIRNGGSGSWEEDDLDAQLARLGADR